MSSSPIRPTRSTRSPPQHIRAASSYINHEDNAAKYDEDEVESIKRRIMRAAKKHDIEIDPDTVN